MLQTSSGVEQDWEPARVCVRGSVSAVQFVTVTAASSQHPAWLWGAPSQPWPCPCSSSWLSLLCPAVLGKLLLSFFLYPKMLNPGKIKAGPQGISRFQSHRVNKDRQSFFFFFLSPSLTQGYKNSLQIQTEEQTAKHNTLKMKIKMFLFWHFWSGTTWLHILRWTLLP